MADNWQDCLNVAKLVIFFSWNFWAVCRVTYVIFHENSYTFFEVLGLILFSEIILVTLFTIVFFLSVS